MGTDYFEGTTYVEGCPRFGIKERAVAALNESVVVTGFG
jgi:hypothetical protein